MKLRYALLIALACLFAAPFAQASPVDPSVIVNKKGGDPVFTGSFTVTLDSDGGADVSFTNGLDVAITELSVEFTGVPAPSAVSCGGTAFAHCMVDVAIAGPHTFDEDFIFSGGPGIAPGEGFTFVAAGFEGANPSATISSATPEPATIFLLLTGGAMLIGFGRKW